MRSYGLMIAMFDGLKGCDVAFSKNRDRSSGSEVLGARLGEALVEGKCLVKELLESRVLLQAASRETL